MRVLLLNLPTVDETAEIGRDGQNLSEFGCIGDVAALNTDLEPVTIWIEGQTTDVIIL